MSKQLKIRLSFISGVISWVLFSFFEIYFIILDRYEISEAYVEYLPQIFLTLFILSTLTYYRYVVTKAESINFLDLLWKVFMTGLVTTIISLAIRLIFTSYADTSFMKNPVTINFFYNIYVGLVIIYLVSTFVVWKRLILYQKSKNLIQLWNFFEWALLLSLAFDFFGFNLESNSFNVALVVLTTFSIVLSFNLKWIAYLNFRQKWKSILFILLSGIYLYHFFLNMTIYKGTGALIYDLLDRVFVVSILVFIFIYAAIAVLVTLFNLPTSSVFERKLKEAVDFQKLSQSVPAGQSENETYDILIDSSMSAVFADAAWLEVEQDGDTRLITRGVSYKEVDAIKEAVKNEQVKKIIDIEFNGRINAGKVFTSVSKGYYRSVFALPINIQGTQVGALVLLQEVSDAFNNEMVSIITTFVNQAGITLENARLLDEAIDNERYKEQLKIAKLVQKSLLPGKIDDTPNFTIAAYSVPADEVGGDYYDAVRLSDEKFALIIGDVSGKGTSAAFNMAQMKGIFHSLVRMELSTEEFMVRANESLSSCLEKSSFITSSFYIINTERREIDFVRAGHCPTLVYRAESCKAEFLQTKGMGLGIVRNSQYSKYVESNTLHYSAGDVVLLYTDGITEATNNNQVQFGNEGLRNALLSYSKLSPEEIKDGIIEELYSFLGNRKMDDDYTLVILKFT